MFFSGDKAGLVAAEIELGSVDKVPELPEWVGEGVTDDVTDDVGYYNASLVRHPYRRGLRHSHCRHGPV